MHLYNHRPISCFALLVVILASLSIKVSAEETFCSLCVNGTSPQYPERLTTLANKLKCSQMDKLMKQKSACEASQQRMLDVNSFHCGCKDAPLPTCSITSGDQSRCEDLIKTTEAICPCYTFCNDVFVGCTPFDGGSIACVQEQGGEMVSGCQKPGITIEDLMSVESSSDPNDIEPPSSSSSSSSSSSTGVYDVKLKGTLKISCPQKGDTCTIDGPLGAITGSFSATSLVAETGGEIISLTDGATVEINQASVHNSVITTISCDNDACTCINNFGSSCYDGEDTDNSAATPGEPNPSPTRDPAPSDATFHCMYVSTLWLSIIVTIMISDFMA